MQVLLIFSAALLLAVFISGWTSRSVLSTAVLFLFAGIVAGKGGLGLVILEPEGPVLMPLAEVALLSVLFTDSMKIQGSELRRAWRLPGRALLLGLPLTVVLAAAAAHWLVVATVCVGAFMGQLDASIVTLAFPTLRAAFHASVGEVEWVALAYFVVLVGTVTAVGRFADAVGRKLLYIGQRAMSCYRAGP